MLTIWGRPNSHNVKKVAWFAEEAGLRYVRHDVGGQFGMGPDYIVRNPNALIPTIEDDGVVLWESNAILRYLAAAHAPAFWPDSLAARAQADKWMDWQFSYADAQRDAFIQLIRKAPPDRDHTVIAKSVKACANLLTVLDVALSRQAWLSGDTFGIGDIPMGVYAHTWFTLDIDRPPFVHVRNWYERLRERPGFHSTVAIALT
jgi:glutathione S-transferase